MKNMLTVFKALSDETRLRIMKLLEGGELCICKIMEITEMKQSRVSRHMGILKNAGLVVDRREGKWVHYSLNSRPAHGCCEQVIAVLERCVKDHDVIVEDRAKLRKLLDREKKGLWRPKGKESKGGNL
jgi:ArsR family transcriptional regulator, arsenate/arsenite/antimonite-responsive transcriptional repressor